MSTITLPLSAEEVARLRLPVLGSGGYQVFLHRLQRGLKGRQLRIDTEDLGRLVSYVRQGPGGFQQRLPVRSLSPYLPSIAPLFASSEAPRRAPRWIYFIQDRERRIKIGGTHNPKRRGGGYRTDNADYLELLLLLPEEPGRTERDLQRRFAAYRIPVDDLPGHRQREQEWFWPGQPLLIFIEHERHNSARIP